MRTSAIFLSAVLAALGAVEVGAVTVTPAGPFSATGQLALSKGSISTTCTTTFTGMVTAEGRITVTELTFKGGLICSRISAVGLPWGGRADSDAQLTIEGMQVNIRAPLLGGLCGPVNVVAAWEKDRAAAHFRQVQLPADCRMDGTMLTTPAVVVTP